MTQSISAAIVSTAKLWHEGEPWGPFTTQKSEIEYAISIVASDITNRCLAALGLETACLFGKDGRRGDVAYSFGLIVCSSLTAGAREEGRETDGQSISIRFGRMFYVAVRDQEKLADLLASGNKAFKSLVKSDGENVKEFVNDMGKLCRLYPLSTVMDVGVPQARLIHSLATCLTTLFSAGGVAGSAATVSPPKERTAPKTEKP